MTREPIPTLNYFAAPPARRARFVAWVALVTVMVAGTAGWLFLLRGPRILDSDAALIVGWALLAAAVLAVAVLLRTTPTDALRLAPRASYWTIILTTILLHSLALLWLRPALSQDWIRYRLDGRMWLSGISPYAATPRQWFQQVPFDETDTLVPFWELHTIYPPAGQAVFVAASALERVVWPQRGGAFGFVGWRDLIAHRPLLDAGLVVRALFAAAAVAATGILLSILAGQQASLWWSVLFAWNPLVVLETGGMGHVDIVGVLFILLTIRALQSHRPLLAAGMLALAVGVKPPALLLAPFLVRDAWAGGSIRRFVWLPVVFVLFLAVVYSPMLIGRGYVGWMNTARLYATSWEANGSIYELIKSTADESDGGSVQRAKDRARLIAAVMVLVTMLLAWRFRADFATAGYWIYLVILLLAPVVYPWYLLWPLCFVPLLRGGGRGRGGGDGWQGLTVLVWAATVGVSYFLWRTSDWVLPTRWLLVEYVPVYAALLVELTKLATHKWTIHSTV